MDVRTNPLTMAPHTQGQVIASDWNRPYTREQAAFPAVSTLYQSSKKNISFGMSRVKQSKKILFKLLDP
jgi:hypothetical protein